VVIGQVGPEAAPVRSTAAGIVGSAGAGEDQAIATTLRREPLR
jgi:hypothetical protein